MRYALLLLLLYFAVCANAQQRVNVDDLPAHSAAEMSAVNGSPLSFYKYVRVTQGSPFFIDEWMKGTLTMKSGVHCNSIMMKLNLLDDEVYYKDFNGNDMIANSMLSNLSITNSKTNESYQFDFFPRVNSTKKDQPTGWLELLSTGKHITLYKKYKKQLNEIQPYGSATVEQRIQTFIHYYVLCNDEMYRVKSLDDLAAMIPQKRENIADYITVNKLKLKHEADLANLVGFINRL